MKTLNVQAGPLDSIRAQVLLKELKINATLEDSSPRLLVFNVVGEFLGIEPKLSNFYGVPLNKSIREWSTKRLIWTVPEVRGEICLQQIGNATCQLVFRQL